MYVRNKYKLKRPKCMPHTFQKQTVEQINHAKLGYLNMYISPRTQ